MDFVMNGQGYGSVAAQLLANDMNPGVLRPYLSNNANDPRTFVTNAAGLAVPTNNNTAALRKDDWLILDSAVIRTAKPRLKAVANMRSKGLQYTIPNGMSKTVLQYERQSDISNAIISMDGNRRSEGDRPVFDLNNLPLPIIHKDFSYSLRQLSASRNGDSPLDTTTAELAARRCAEQAEQLLLGVTASYAYGGGTIYGLMNFPSRITKVMTNPTSGGYLPSQTLQEVLAMRLLAQQAYHFGPYTLYTSLAWDTALDSDYIINVNGVTSGITLRQRLANNTGISQVQTLDYLPGYTMILVEDNADVARMVIGMDFVTVQWEVNGGMEVRFKVMCIMVPQLRADIAGNTGIVHGTAT